MTTIDIKQEIRKSEDAEKVHAIRKNAELKKKADVAKKKPLEMFPSVKSTYKEPKEEQIDLKNDNDCSGFKKGVFLLASKTMRDTDKQKKFHENLSNSNFLNKYVDKRMYLAVLENLDIDQRAVVTYSYHYLNTLLT